MKTIKLIDLLNKIAKGEELPKIIKFHEQYYQLTNEAFGDYKDYISTSTDNYLFDDDWNLTGNLNEEVEIIEEDKIKRIEERESGWWANSADGNVSTLKQAVNELIDAVNEMRKEK